MVQIIFTLLGIIAVLCVPALWVAWDEAIYYGVLITFFSVIGVIVALAWLFPAQTLSRRPQVPQSDDDPLPADPGADPAPGPGQPSEHWFAQGGPDDKR